MCVWSLFRVFSSSCMFWNNVEIMELKREETHSCSEISQSRHSARLSIDRDTLSSLDSDARRRADLFEADLSSDDSHNYKTAPS